MWLRLPLVKNTIRLLKAHMTHQEVAPYIGKPVRLTLADGRVLAGTFQNDDNSGHDHPHYAVVSDPVFEGGKPVIEVLHGTDGIVDIEDASDDPAATQ